MISYAQVSTAQSGLNSEPGWNRLMNGLLGLSLACVISEKAAVRSCTMGRPSASVVGMEDRAKEDVNALGLWEREIRRI